MNFRSMAWISEQELTKPDTTARKDTTMFTVYHNHPIRRAISGLLTTNILCHEGRFAATRSQPYQMSFHHLMHVCWFYADVTVRGLPLHKIAKYQVEA